MTAPRRIVPGQYYFITRRTLLRMFLLRPNPAVNQMFEYCFAEAAERHGIELIAWCAMSNHYHAVIYDPDRSVPAFLERFHRMLAKALNRHYGRFESVWSREQTCLVRLVTMSDVFDKVVYVLSNPAAAHLVEDIAHWPGSSSWLRMGRPAKTVKRPENGYFSVDGLMPAEVQLRAVAPRDLLGETEDDWIQRVRAAVLKRQRALAKERHSPVIGASAVMKMNPYQTPSSDAPRSNLQPHLACKDRERMDAEVRVLKNFRATYREMRMRLLAEGPAAVEFPEGTYRLRLMGLRCKDCAETATQRPPATGSTSA